MAKQYYKLEEALEVLNITEADLKILVREGKLREFRHGNQLHFKVEDVNAIATASDSEASATGELTLMPSEDDSIAGLSGAGLTDVPSLSDAAGLSDAGLSGFGLADSDTGKSKPSDESKTGLSGSDILALADEPREPGEPRKDDTVVTSVGISVFDDDDLELDADPMAKTVLSDAEGDALGGESTGSGSGLLDLTRESDDTSLGAELLDEIYSEEDDSVQMGDATRAGLVQEAAQEEEIIIDHAATSAPVAYREIEEASSPAFTGLLILSVLSMIVVGGVCAAVVRGVWPSYLETIFDNIQIVIGGAFGVAAVIGIAGWLMGRRSGGGKAAAVEA